MDVYNDVAASLLKYCNDFITRNSINATFKVYDFDAFGAESELPPENLIGIAEYSIENVDRQYYATCMLVVCTKASDDALKLLRSTVGQLFKDLPVDKKTISIVGATTGTVTGNFVVMDNIKVLPVARTDTRPLQMIAVSFGTAFLTPP